MSTTCGCEHCHSHGSSGLWMPTVSFVLLVIGLIGKYSGISWFAESWIEAIWFLVAFLPVGLPVMREAWEEALRKDFFSEFSLMAIASIGAFCIGEYPEAVAVMLFYTVGERLQLLAVNKASKNISDLLDVRPERTDVWRTGTYMNVSPKDVKVGERIEVKPGGRVPLDGVLLEAEVQFDTSALTGESMPRSIREGEEVLAGMIVQGQAVRIQVNRPYEQSALARILALVKDASERKAPAELFIRRFARIYTPIVILLSFLIVSVPALVGMVTPSFQYVFSDWLYRGLVFLVISCPCALVISVPLGYFGGIGAASRAGILFKGGNYLDAITRVNTVAFDKTGTLTTGCFEVTTVESTGIPASDLLSVLLSVERKSTHPVAQAVVRYAEKQDSVPMEITDMRELAGHGAEAIVNGRQVLVGNIRLLAERDIPVPKELSDSVSTVVVCAIDGKYAGHLLLSDTLKKDAVDAIRRLKDLDVKDICLLSGDKQEIVNQFAERLGVDKAYGNLLPEDKAAFVRDAKAEGHTVVMIGDGINDSPALSAADIGIAIHSGAAIAREIADVTIRADSLEELVTLKAIANALQKRVGSNYRFVLSFNSALILLGALGILPPATSAMLHNLSTLGISLRSMTDLLEQKPSL